MDKQQEILQKVEQANANNSNRWYAYAAVMPDRVKKGVQSWPSGIWGLVSKWDVWSKWVQSTRQFYDTNNV